MSAPRAHPLTRFPDELVGNPRISDFAVRLYAWTVAWMIEHPESDLTVIRAAKGLHRHRDKVTRAYRELSGAGFGLPVDTAGWPDSAGPERVDRR
jgi:hypothetical protein